MEDPGRIEKISLNLPSAVRLESAPPDRTLSGMLAAGEIDGIIGPAVALLLQGSGSKRRLAVQGHGASSVAVFSAHRHLSDHACHRRPAHLGRASIPGCPRRCSRPSAPRKLWLCSGLPIPRRPRSRCRSSRSSSWRRERCWVEDFWSYGFTAGNRKVLDTFLGYHYAQGLSARRVTPEELFHPGALELYKI